MDKQYFLINQTKEGYFGYYQTSNVKEIIDVKENLQKFLGDKIVFLSEFSDTKEYSSLMKIVGKANSSGKIDIGSLEKMFKISYKEVY